jgi:DNA-binding GntR family transcriptional regulator
VAKKAPAKTRPSEALLALKEADLGGDAGGGAGERTYALLRAGILRDVLPAGTLLAEADLAETLKISRTPVRSALQMLLQEGLVELGSRRQLYVRGFASAERSEVIMLREALERLAVAEASKVIELNEIDELRLTLIRQRRAADAGDVEGFIDLDDQFHLKIAVGARLPTLQKFLGQLRAFTRMMGLRVATYQGRMYAVLEEHDAIVTALEARDQAAALAALDQHLSTTYALLAQLEDDTPPPRPRKRTPRKR